MPGLCGSSWGDAHNKFSPTATLAEMAVQETAGILRPQRTGPQNDTAWAGARNLTPGT